MYVAAVVVITVALTLCARTSVGSFIRFSFIAYFSMCLRNGVPSVPMCLSVLSPFKNARTDSAVCAIRQSVRLIEMIVCNDYTSFIVSIAALNVLAFDSFFLSAAMTKHGKYSFNGCFFFAHLRIKA